MNTLTGVLLTACVVVLLLIAIAVVISLLSNGPRARVVIAQTEADLSGLTACTWCRNLGASALPDECTCREKCPEIGWCRSEWTTALITPSQEHQ
jgi:hypothetical protein